MKKVKDFMTQNVVCLSPEDSVFNAAKVFYELKISEAPVCKNRKPVGIVTISDIIHFLNIKFGLLPAGRTPSLTTLFLTLFHMQKLSRDLKKEIKKILSSKVNDVMSKNPRKISPEASFLDATEMMEKHRVHSLLVVKRGKLVGIVSGSDIIKVLIE